MSDLPCIQSVNEYIAEITAFKKQVGNKHPHNLVFRGQSYADWSLSPKIFRDNYKHITRTEEKGILRSFIQQAFCYVSNISPDADYRRWMGYAQHFHAPTRLLDWSLNPLVALWFACSENNIKKDGGVWLLDRETFYRYSKCTNAKHIEGETNLSLINQFFDGEGNKDIAFSFPLLSDPPYSDIRMSAQRSAFMIWGNDHRDLEKQLGEISGQEIVRGVTLGTAPIQHNLEDVLRKVLIPFDKKSSIINELDAVGINEATCFPGLEGIGRYLSRAYNRQANSDKQY